MNCPKCGAPECEEADGPLIRRWLACGSVWGATANYQSDKCRVAELEAENAKLRERLSQYEPEPGEYCQPCNLEYKRAAQAGGEEWASL